MARKREEEHRRAQKAAQPAGGQTPATPASVSDGGWPKGAPWAVDQKPVTPAAVEDSGRRKPVTTAAVDYSTLSSLPGAGGQTPATGSVAFGTTPPGWLKLPTGSKNIPAKGSVTSTPTPKSPTGRGSQGHGKSAQSP